MADLSEKEQLDAMRAWWSENWKFVIGGIAVGLAIVIGMYQYRETTEQSEVAASTLYEDVMFAAGTGDLDAAEESASALFADYNKTPYAAQARLAMARIYMDNARDQDAANVLNAMIETQPDLELAMIGRLRLAKILLYQGKADEVIALIRDQPESAFSARYNEVLGDAYVAQERYTEAEAAYILALNDNPGAPTVDTGLIQLKINDLPPVNQSDNIASETDPAADVVPSDEEAGNEEETAEDLPAEENTEGPVNEQSEDAPGNQ